MRSVIRLAVSFLAMNSATAAFVYADEAADIAALREAGFNLRQTHGTVEMGWGKAEWTPELWMRLAEIRGLTVLRGTARCADNAGLEVLAKLPHLESVYLNASTFDDDGFATLAKIKSLKSLAFDHNQRFTGQGAAALRALTELRSLRFGGCMKFTGDGVRAVAELSQLESLQLHHCGVGDADLPPLGKLTRLKSLFVSAQFNGRLTGSGLKHLAGIASLESLKIGETVLAFEGGLDALVGLRHLKTLELDKVGASEPDVQKLRQAMPHTEIKWTPASADEIAQFHRREARGKESQR